MIRNACDNTPALTLLYLHFKTKYSKWFFLSSKTSVLYNRARDSLYIVIFTQPFHELKSKKIQDELLKANFKMLFQI